MRFLRLRAQGFRAFSSSVSVDLDADVVVLSGPNGQGKTSLLDGILWALSGCIERFEGATENVVSLYSPTGEAEVELDIGSAGNRWTVHRAWDGEGQRLHLSGPAGKWSGREAAVELSRLLRTPEQSSEFSDLQAPALHRTLTRAVYLQQDLVRVFVETDDETSRYENLSQLFGTRRVVDLQVELEHQKASWSKGINVDSKEVLALEDELSRLEAEIEDLQGGEARTLSVDEWERWWEEVSSVRGLEVDHPTMSSSEAPFALDRGLRTVESERQRVERNLIALEALMSDVSSLQDDLGELPPIDELTETVQSAERMRAQLEAQLQSAEATLAESRRAVAMLRDEAKDRALLSRLALRHLGDVCPICQQEYDRDATEQRLEATASAESGLPELPDTQAVDRLRGELQDAEKSLALARQEVETASDERRRIERLRNRLQELQVPEAAESRPTEWKSLLSKRCTSMNELVGRLRHLKEDGETLSLVIARAGEIARLEALREERQSISRRLDQLKGDLRSREETGDLAQSVIEGLREAGQSIVSNELHRIRPMAQGIYSAIDPHPALRRIDMSATVFRGRGRVTTSVKDPDTSATSERPDQVLSSSQLNALA